MSKTFVWWIQTSDWSRSSTRSPRVFPELSARLMGFLQPLTRGARVEDVWLIVCVSVCVTKYDINIIPPSLWNFFYLFYYWFIKCRFIRVMTFSDVKLQEMNQLLLIIYEATWNFCLCFYHVNWKKNIFLNIFWGFGLLVRQKKQFKGTICFIFHHVIGLIPYTGHGEAPGCHIWNVLMKWINTVNVTLTLD